MDKFQQWLRSHGVFSQENPKQTLDNGTD